MQPSWLAAEAFDVNTYPRSWWAASLETPSQPYPRLEGEKQAEVAIIGAGYTGLNAALGLAKRHAMDTIVLEAGQPGWGASGRNGGFCSPGGAHMSYQDMISKWGLETTREFCQVQEAAISHVGDLGETLGIDFDRAGSGEYILGSGPRVYGEAVEEARWMNQSLGVAASAMNQDELKERGLHSPLFTGALHMPKGFGLHPLKYSLGLARAAAEAGVRIFGDSAVTAWRQDGAGHVLQTAHGTVRAKRVLLATNGYTPAGVGSPVAGRLMPVFSNILVTRKLSAEELKAQGWMKTELAADDRELLHYFRLLPDGRFMFGGRGGIGGKRPEEALVQRRLEAEFRTLFPAWKDVGFDYFWSGLVCLCRDNVFHVGALPEKDNAWYGLAFHGGGVSMASWTGAALADMVAGASSSEFKIPAPMRKPIPWIPFPALRPMYLRGAYAWFGLKERLQGKKLVTD